MAEAIHTPPAADDRLGDSDLLQRFAARGEEAAFAALVRRHGPVVLGVCRRLLRCPEDAEDVFQATFLVLARQAGSIHKQRSVGSWLYGVAWRLAGKARSKAARQRLPVPPLPNSAPDAHGELTWRELCAGLDEELKRLPEKYRAPLLSCYWQGLTQDDAARRLGWPRGTLKRRLERARELLHDRLTRRGLTLSAALLATMLAQNKAWATAPTALAADTVRAALRFADTGIAPGVSARALELAQAWCQAWVQVRLRFGAALLLALGLTAGGLRLLAPRAPAGKHPEARRDVPAPAAPRQPDVRGDRPAYTGRVSEPTQPRWPDDRGRESIVRS
jgi:RNA polymerase sigma factor (sigma-70 family)